MQTNASVHLDLADQIAEFYADPLGFVLFAYPWGQVNTPLHGYNGPDENQREFLTSLGEEVKARKFDGATPVMPIRMAESSGHGTGKSAMGAWLAGWLLSTRMNSIGTVTAGTATQLKERTWAAIRQWTSLSITHDWFDVQRFGIYAKERWRPMAAPDTWKVVTQSCKEENSQSFAGQHAATSTSWYLFDEASRVPDGIWDVAYGGLTDGEPMMFAWGQPERNRGRFYEVCFGKEAHRWNHRNVDSRTSKFTNKALIEEWIQDYGIDSDWCRVRILGKAPLASELQFIDLERVKNAQVLPIRGALPDEPLVVGVDVSGGGSAWNVIYFRRGLDGRTIPRVRIPGQAIRHDRGVLVNKLAGLLQETQPDKRIAAMFIDSAFGSPIVERLNALGYKDRVHEINFGAESPDAHQLNMRAYMWDRMKEWLLNGSIPRDENLQDQLTLPGYHSHPRTNKLVIESKQDLMKRGEKSPDDADALALTFARPVAIPRPKPRPYVGHGGPWS